MWMEDGQTVIIGRQAGQAHQHRSLRHQLPTLHRVTKSEQCRLRKRYLTKAVTFQLLTGDA